MSTRHRGAACLLTLTLAVFSVACGDEHPVDAGATLDAASPTAGDASTAGIARDAGLDAEADASPHGDTCEPLPDVDAPMAPELEGGIAWLNTDQPLRLSDLRGYVVLLDFWTYGCVNCLHQMPVLRAIEDEFAGEPFVVIGVHSAKFFTEREAQKINLAIQQYDIRHPVVVDSELKIWDAYGVGAWPTTVLIDAQGRRRRRQAGEFSASYMVPKIRALLDESERSCTAETDPVSYLTDPTAAATDPLLFPNAVLALPDGSVAIADSSHHRVVIQSTDGQTVDIIGNGIAGWLDGPFASAELQRPEGMALVGDTLYIADADNHVILAAHLTERTVETVAGVGMHGTRYSLAAGFLPAREVLLSSPWDLEPVDGGLAVAMAGNHQLYLFDPEGEQIRVLSGSGIEALTDGTARECAFAQPNGLSLSADGATLYVADTESSAIRAVTLADGSCQTLVGRGLFTAGDRDGVGSEVLLQHAAGVETMSDGSLLVADTYNSKMKQLLPDTLAVTTLGWPPPELALDEPRGISRSGDVVYVADTNHHRIIVHDQSTGQTDVLDLGDLAPPALFGAAAP